MAFGYATFDSGGAQVFSTDDATWTLLYVGAAPANTTVTVNDVPIMPTRIVTRQMINQITGDDESYVHTFALSENTLTATAPDTSNTKPTFFMVFGR